MFFVFSFFPKTVNKQKKKLTNKQQCKRKMTRPTNDCGNHCLQTTICYFAHLGKVEAVMSLHNEDVSFQKQAL